MKILVGSKNNVKVQAAKEAFSKYFEDLEVEGLEVDSGVPKQPVGKETFEGAKNRVKNLQKKGKADFYIGIEGGIFRVYGRHFSAGVVCISDGKRYSFGISSFFPLPKEVIEEVKKGKELGEVMDLLLQRENIKQNEGAIGVFTKGRISRKELYIQPIVCALIPFINQNFNFD